MKFVSLLLLICSFSNLAYADCDFSTGISQGPNNTFVYSEECHKKVGQLVQDNTTKDKQISDLTQAINLKDLALTQGDARTQNWINTSTALEDRITKIDSEQKHNEWIYFGLGVLTTFLGGYAAAKLAGH